MIVETSVSKRMPIKNVPYSSQSFSITIRNDEAVSSIDEVRSKIVEMHDFLEQIVDNKLSLIRAQAEIIELPKPTLVRKPASEKQIALITKLLAESETIDESDLFHVLETAFSVGKLTDLSSVEASKIIDALIAKDISHI